MSTDLATIGLTYDAIDIQEPGLGIFLEITYGLHEDMEVRGRDVLVPTREGQFARSRVKNIHKILLTGHVRGNGTTQEDRQADFRTNSRFLRTLFASDRMPADLVALMEDGVTATIPARPNGPALWNETVKSEYAYVSIELLAVRDWSFSDTYS